MDIRRPPQNRVFQGTTGGPAGPSRPSWYRMLSRYPGSARHISHMRRHSVVLLMPRRLAARSRFPFSRRSALRDGVFLPDGNRAAAAFGRARKLFAPAPDVHGLEQDRLLDDLAGTKHRRAFDDVLQLADVSRPPHREQQRAGFLGKRPQSAGCRPRGGRAGEFEAQAPPSDNTNPPETAPPSPARADCGCRRQPPARRCGTPCGRPPGGFPAPAKPAAA